MTLPAPSSRPVSGVLTASCRGEGHLDRSGVDAEVSA